MNLHEFQAKALLKKFGVTVLPGYLAYTPREAQKASLNLGGLCAIKAQVHAGGRGKAGGVKIAKTPEEAQIFAAEILGKTLVTPQTGEEGKLVRKVWVEGGAEISREFYLSVLVDRTSACVSIIASAEGGMEIEEVAEGSPDKILQVKVAPECGLQAFHIRRIAYFLGINSADQKKFAPMVRAVYNAFLGLDCELLEINPLIQTKSGDFICLDAKMSIDDNALYRQKEAHDFLDYDEVDPRELRAGELGISYIALSGNIGCMVNGAGLAMATMDVIKQNGGRACQFLDVGGGASQEKVTEAFKIILEDSSVKGILVNIFGGIMKCDIIAKGIIEAAKTLDIQVPLVVRLRGTNYEEGQKLLAESGLKITTADGMTDAAQKIVQALGAQS